jgi:hypothetical protein
MPTSYLHEQIIKAVKERVYTELGYHKEVLLPEEEIIVDIAANMMQFYQREITAIQDLLKAERNDRINYKNLMQDLINENEELKKEAKNRKSDFD